MKLSLVFGCLAVPGWLMGSVVMFAVARAGAVKPALRCLTKKMFVKLSLRSKILHYVLLEMTKPTSNVLNFIVLQPDFDTKRLTGSSSGSSSTISLNSENDTIETVV